MVDNDSADGSAAMVETEFPDARLIKPGANLGYAAGNNLAFGHAQGDWLLTLNPDTEFQDDSLSLACDALAEQPKAGCLAVRLVGPDGRTQRSVRGFPTPLGVMGQALGIDRLAPGSVWGSYSLPQFDYDRPGPAPQPMGTFLLFRREALAAVGDPRAPFDEKFPIFFNEVDLLYRLHKSGWSCWYEPRAHVLHHHGASTRQVRKSMVWESHRSLVRYFDKHLTGPARLWLPLVWLLATLSALVRAKGVYAGFRAQRDDL